MKHFIYGAVVLFSFCFSVLGGVTDTAAASETQKSSAWYFWTNQGGAGNYSQNNGLNTVDITVPGPERWSAGITSPGFNLEKGKKYLVEFEAKAVPPIEITSQAYFNTAPWTSYSGENAFKLSAAMKKYSFIFTMKAGTDPKAGFQFMFGGQAKSTVTYSNATIKCLGIDEQSAVSANKDSAQATGDGIWYFWTNDTGKGSYSVDNGIGKVNITEPGQYRWSAGVSEPGFNLQSGYKYRVDFEAKSLPPMEITSQAYYNAAPWTSYSKAHVFQLAGSMKAFSYTFTMYMDTDPKAGLQFMFGGQKKGVLSYNKAVITCLGKDETAVVFPAGLKDKRIDRGINDCTVFVFGQSNPMEEDQQIYRVKPNLNIRAFNKWGLNGKYPSDYNPVKSHKYHYLDILLSGGITTAIQKKEFKNDAEFMDMATRDADGEPVSWSEFIGEGMYRGALANPKYRQYLINTCKMQIDAGVDGIHFDEPNSSYLGGPAKNWSGNEGFDDYSISDFNKYLMEKYPDYTDADWKKNFKMSDDNIIRKGVPPDDLEKNFNYRKYLKKNGWTGVKWGVDTVFESSNPLAKEWGKQIGNREYQDGSFTASYIRKYLREIFDAARQYGMEKYGKKILFTTNGIAPEVDYNSFGIYMPNPDNTPNDWKGLKLVPVKNNTLDGTVPEMDNYRKILSLSRETSGDVPLVFFLDFPNEVINGYYGLPVEQKKDFWRIYAAEAYAAGCYYAFALSTVMDGEPTAEASGVLDFFREYAGYYREHSYLYHDNSHAENKVDLAGKNISYNLMKQDKNRRLALHLINHNYKQGIIPQAGITAGIAVNEKPANVYMVSPDFEGKKEVENSYDGKSLKLNISSLKYYDVIVIE